MCYIWLYFWQESTTDEELKEFTHPIHVADLFTPNATRPTRIDMKPTVDGLSKLLLFNAFTKAKKENAIDLAVKEAKKYPYSLKEETVVRKSFQCKLVKSEVKESVNIFISRTFMGLHLT